MVAFEVDPEALRAAQQAAEVVRGGVGPGDRNSPPRRTERSPPDGEARSALSGRLCTVAQGMDSHASAALTSAAEDYQERDDAAARGFGGAGPPLMAA